MLAINPFLITWSLLVDWIGYSSKDWVIALNDKYSLTINSVLQLPCL